MLKLLLCKLLKPGRGHLAEADCACAVSLDRQGSQAVDVLKMSPADWFGRWQESGAGEALPGTEDYPSSLGKVLSLSTHKSGSEMQHAVLCGLRYQALDLPN